MRPNTQLGKYVVGGICAALALLGLFYGRLFDGRSEPWTQVWYERFSGPAGSAVNPRYWRFQTGQGVFGNGEIEKMTDSTSNVHLDGTGALDISALGQGSSWTSGRIQTTTMYGAPAGGELRIVASIRQPAPADGLGYWPAFWLLGPGSWPEHGEIDILEDVNALSEHSGALHCGNLSVQNPNGTFGPCHEHVGLSSGMRPCRSCQRSYHTYSVIIDRRDPSDGHIYWYLDGHEFFQLNEQGIGAHVWDEAVNHGFRIILDLAIGGSFPDGRCGCSTPTSRTSSGGTMRISYVGVYKR